MIAVLLSTMLLAADAAPPTGASAPSAAAAASSVSVTATPRTHANAAPLTKVANNGDAMTCWVEKPAGSHVMKTVCATLEELDKAKRDADDALNTRNFNRGAIAK
jgi:hypothetical protein